MRATQQRAAELTVIGGRRSATERFTAIVQPHYEVLYRVAYRLTRSVPDAEDLVQEVCARAYERLADIEALEQPRGWLLRVLYRLYIDSTRRYERRYVSSIDEVHEAALVSERPSPAEETERAIERRRLERVWRHLDQEQRLLLVLHDVEGHTLAELNEVTGLKEGTLKSRLYRARVRLGKLLQRDAGDAGAQRRARGLR